MSKAVLIKIGNGYFSNKPGNLTIASHCSPVLLERRPEVGIALSSIYHCHETLTREQGNLNTFKEMGMRNQYFGLIKKKTRNATTMY